MTCSLLFLAALLLEQSERKSATRYRPAKIVGSFVVWSIGTSENENASAIAANSPGAARRPIYVRCFGSPVNGA
jgi:hypothetical protein